MAIIIVTYDYNCTNLSERMALISNVSFRCLAVTFQTDLSQATRTKKNPAITQVGEASI